MAYIDTTHNVKTLQDDINEEFIADVKGKFGALKSEVSERNADIELRDGYVYGDYLQRSIDVPIGHDSASVNWLRRTVEIHKNMFMGRGFQVVSTYDSTDISNAADEKDRARLEIENDKEKTYAEQRMQLIKAISEDNGGQALWATLAENASAIGDVALKMYYVEKEKKIELCEIESIENLYVLWNDNNFRDKDAVAYVYQVSKQDAIGEYGADDDVATSPQGSPFAFTVSNTTSPSLVGQPMVSVIEITGKVEGWGTENGKIKQVKVGDENEFNCLIIGNKITRLITDPKKLPKYYVFPNKRRRRRAWGLSDITDAAVQINQAYVETLSDWRTLARKVNFPKYKAYGFGLDSALPKNEERAVQFVPLSEGQDIQPIAQGDTQALDWGRQLDELKEQFVRETGLSRVLFDDPSVTLNSNQALLTSMKPTSDIAEAKKQLWSPIIVELFQDALELLAAHDTSIKPLVSEDSNWTLRVMWPSVMQKEDPVYQSMILNRFNAGLMSVQSYMEAQGDSQEEIDRLKDEVSDPVTAAILGHQMPLIAQTMVNAATAQLQAWYLASLPQPPPENAGANTPGVSSNGGTAMVTPDNQATGGVGVQPVSQPGTGATSASPAGALAQTVQNNGG